MPKKMEDWVLENALPGMQLLWANLYVKLLKKRMCYGLNGFIPFISKIATGGIIPHLALPAGFGRISAELRTSIKMPIITLVVGGMELMPTQQRKTIDGLKANLIMWDGTTGFGTI